MRKISINAKRWSVAVSNNKSPTLVNWLIPKPDQGDYHAPPFDFFVPPLLCILNHSSRWYGYRTVASRSACVPIPTCNLHICMHIYI